MILHGYRYSVYTRIARMVLAEKNLAYEYAEINPFAPDAPSSYLKFHPFQRVPALDHDGFILYETTAISRYLDEAFPKPALQPTDPRHCARMNQIIAIIDAYAYWPMVRQVFSHRVFKPASGLPHDEQQIEVGLIAANRALAALEILIDPASPLTLADLHLAPMMAYFTAAPEGHAALTLHPKLTAWWGAIQRRACLKLTDPGLPGSS